MSITNLKFLVDVGVGKKVEEFLYNLNYDTRTIREINPRMRIASLKKYPKR
ncbi:MAG: hypothetical protein KJ770_02425 [Actinobacteria bacterium]|nr:hypothetical protein [Actinomycetota bacterium]